MTENVLDQLRRDVVAQLAPGSRPGDAGPQGHFEAIKAAIGGPASPMVPGVPSPWQLTEVQMSILVRGFRELLVLADLARAGIAPDPAGEEWAALAALPARPFEELEEMSARLVTDLEVTAPEGFLALHAAEIAMIHRSLSIWLVDAPGGLRDAGRGGGGA